MNKSISDVVIPTSSADKQNIILKEGQKVMVLKSSKGIYMQLESGKIIAIRTALKVGHNKDKLETPFMAREMQKRHQPITTMKTPVTTTVSNVTAKTTGNPILSTASKTVTAARSRGNQVQFGRNNNANKNVQMVTAKPYNLKPNARTMGAGADASMLPSQYPMSNSNSSFDADISDDSQFLEKLGENLANQQNNHEEPIGQPIKENKCMEPTKCLQNEEKTQTNQIQPSHTNKVNNGIKDKVPAAAEKPTNLQQSQSKPEPVHGPYNNSNSENANNMNNSNGNNFMPHQNYNYNYNSNNSGNYNETQNQPTVPTSQPSMHQMNIMNTQQTDKYQNTTQHVSSMVRLYSCVQLIE